MDDVPGVNTVDGSVIVLVFEIEKNEMVGVIGNSMIFDQELIESFSNALIDNNLVSFASFFVRGS